MWIEKKIERFLNSLEGLANCFGNVFLATRRENVIYTHFSMIQVKFTNINLIIYEFLSKGTFQLHHRIACDFPVKTSIEKKSNLKEFYSNSWTENTLIQDQKGCCYMVR